MVTPVKTPCIGVCSTSIGDNVCRGCKRFTHEVVNWIGYTQAQKISILMRMDALLRQVLESRIDIFDEPLLCQQLELQKVRYHREQSCYSWIFEILKVGAGTIVQLEQFGARLTPNYRHMSLPEFKKMVDDDFFVLSNVHFERYFAKVC